MMEQLWLHFVGYSVFFGALYVVWKSNARRWRRVARKYAAGGTDVSSDEAPCFASRTMQTVILAGGDVGWNSYRGVVNLGLTQKGIRLSLMPVFSIFHPPLFLPFHDCHVEPKQWPLIGKTCQYTIAEVGDVQMIVHEELQQWIEAQCTGFVTATNHAVT